MVAWTGLEHFRVGRFDPPPPAVEPDDFMVRSLNKSSINTLNDERLLLTL